MPIYAMKCHACDSSQDIYRTVAEIDRELPECHGKPMTRRLCAPFVMGDIQPYRSTITGEPIESRSVHRAHLKQHKCIEIGTDIQKPFKAPDVSRDLKADLVRIVHEKARFT